MYIILTRGPNVEILEPALPVSQVKPLFKITLNG